MRPYSRRYPLESLQTAQVAPGLTLIELVVVALIVGLVAAVAIPVVNSQRGLQLDGAARRITADILYVQSQALHKRMPQALIFDPGQGFYYYPTDSDPSQPSIEPISKKDYRILFSKACADEDLLSQSHATDFASVNLDSADFAGGSELYFDSLGFPTDDDGTPLSGASISISSGGSSCTIIVDTVSGRVTIN